MAPLRPLAAALALAVLAVAAGPARAEPAAGVAWRAWSGEAFEAARSGRRLVLLSVSASWCHWCHVMDRETYADSRVAALVAERFVPVRVDADARPDLADRFAEYHWPATAVVTPDGRTLAALRGYRAPDDLLAALRSLSDAVREGRPVPEVDPPSGREVSAPGSEARLPAFRARLRAFLDRTWDDAAGGWGRGQKYPHAAPLEHALLRWRVDADPVARGRALAALAAYERLLDPAWGGVYQYSEGGVWDRPHFEKVMVVNAGALGGFARAHRRTRDARWRRDAAAVVAYLEGFLRTPEGAFRTSQDADLRRPGLPSVEGVRFFALDDAGRRRLGVPRVDPAVYARENGWAIRALCALHRATLDETALAAARRAAERVLATHAAPGGGFRHAEGDRGAFHVGDTVAMGHACLALHQSTGKAAFLDAASRAAAALLRDFRDGEDGGFFDRSAGDDAAGDRPAAEPPEAGDRPVPESPEAGLFRERLRPFEGNASAARFLLAVHAATGDGTLRREALRALESISDPGLAERFGPRAAEALLALEEALRPWARVAVVGRRGDAAADALWRAALALDEPLVSLERLGPGEVSRTGTRYPAAEAAAAFACGADTCSPPVTDPVALARVVRATAAPGLR